MDSQDVSRLEYYQKQGVQADVLVEDVWLDLSADRGAMFSAGSFILNKEEGELSEELQKSLEQEAQVICAKGLKTVSARPPADQRTLGQTITFDAVLDHKLPNFSGGKSMPDAWLPVSEGEGETYIQRRYCASLGCETLCVVEARTGRILRPLTAEREWARLKQLTAFEGIDQPDLNTGHINANGTAMWINKENDLYYIKLDGSEAKRLTSTPEAEELVNFSPDGRFLAYVSANDLWVVDVEEGTPRAITKDGSATILNGKSSWVYYEEVYSRNWQAY
ncbi:MAG: DPP IV N-terminal domain-containing protein [Verrucomicrobia bacterium]|nr:DPP IV N-terminal domain-containing protein [Verrucomicrobiota bacterium]